MGQIDPIAVVSLVAMGLLLAGCAGLRAFLPPLALGIAARAGLVALPREFSWLGQGPALTVLVIAVGFELLGDKIPAIDHLLDAVGFIMKPAAGALVGAVPLFAAMEAFRPEDSSKLLAWGAGIAGAVVGAGASGAVHLMKSQVRLGSSALSAGLANPVISLAEDLIGILGVVLAVLVPLIALATALAVMGILMARSRRRRGPGRSGEATVPGVPVGDVPFEE